MKNGKLADRIKSARRKALGLALIVASSAVFSGCFTCTKSNFDDHQVKGEQFNSEKQGCGLG